MAQRYLRQAGTKKAPFVWTPRRAARPDMVEFDPEMAKTLLEARKEKLAELEAKEVPTDLTPEIIDDLKELADIESKIKRIQDKKAGVPEPKIDPEVSAEELDAQERQTILNKDVDILKIKEMTDEELTQCAAEDYGLKLKPKMDVEEKRALILAKRTKVIFEK